MSHLVRRGGIYHFRCRIPADLLSVVGRRELTRSLGTACPRQARQLAAEAYIVACNQFDELRMARKQPPMIETIDDDQVGEATQVKKPASRFTYDYLTKQALVAKKVQINALSRDLDDLKKSENIGRKAEALAEIRGMLGDLGLRVKATVTPTVADFLHNQYSTEKKLQDDARRHVENYVTLFARITGNKTLSEYTRTDVVNYVRTLEKIKNSLGKSPGDKDKTVEVLLAESYGKATMNATTIDKHLSHVKSFFTTGNKHLRFSTTDEINDMFDGIGPSDFVPRSQKRKSWSINQLTALFASPIWSGTASKQDALTKRHLSGASVYRDAYWWLPIVALYSGARLEEICQTLFASRGVRIHWVKVEGLGFATD